MSLVNRTYELGLRFSGSPEEKRELEQQANLYVRRHQEIVQEKIVEKKMVDHAYDLMENSKLSGTMGAAALAKSVGDRSNIGQVSCNYVVAAVKGNIDREKKLAIFLDLLKQHPRDLISWLLFDRTPHLEGVLSKILGVKFDYARNLVIHAGRMHSKISCLLLPEIKQEDIAPALDSLIAEVQEKLIDNKQKRIKAFLNKLLFLKKHQDFLGFVLYHWVQFHRENPHATPWKSLKTLAKRFCNMLGYKQSKKLFSAIRGVLLLVLQPYYAESIQDILGNITARDLLAKPYTRKREKLAPVDLIMGSKYVISRPGNGDVMTDFVRRKGGFTIGIKNPYKKKDDPSPNRRREISAEAIFSKRVRKMINMGAVISSLRISSGPAPGHKIKVDVILKGPREVFLSNRFMQNHHIEGKTDIIGLDINRVSPYILVFSHQVQLPKNLLTICQRYLHRAEVISQLSRAISKQKEGSRKYIKLQGERNRVYKRRKNLLKQIKQECRMLTAAVLVQTGAKVLNIENLELSARGKRGSLARAILNMPDELHIFEQAVILASAVTGSKIELKEVNPSGSSTTHYGCMGKLLRGPGHWDHAPCQKCGIEVNTHLNAAQFIRDGGLQRPLSA